MDNEINKEEEQLEESGYTTFGGSAGRAGNLYTPTGPVGRFFAKLWTQARYILWQGIP